MKQGWVMVLLGLIAAWSVAAADEAGSDRDRLKPLASFKKIDNDEERGRALFQEIGRVLQHPRCTNCHPRTDRPLQGEDGALHQPLVVRGLDGMGSPPVMCNNCHLDDNVQNVPGNPRWRLAPASMAWEGHSLSEICRQIKDEKRNGGRSLQELGEHMAHDRLVAYGWNPPGQLEPVPGSQEVFGKLFYAWIDAGAQCPGSE
ncbi:Isoquinoline 1-oxidoreductase subunit [Marinobacteraceae bacterium S3BR75-40.1]